LGTIKITGSIITVEFDLLEVMGKEAILEYPYTGKFQVSKATIAQMVTRAALKILNDKWESISLLHPELSPDPKDQLIQIKEWEGRGVITLTFSMEEV
jgi:hypothetical protein